MKMISFFVFPCNGAPVEWNWQGKPEVLGEKPVPVTLCPPQIPHGLTGLATNRLSHGTVTGFLNLFTFLFILFFYFRSLFSLYSTHVSHHSHLPALGSDLTVPWPVSPTYTPKVLNVLSLPAPLSCFNPIGCHPIPPHAFPYKRRTVLPALSPSWTLDLKDETDTFSRNVGKELPLDAA
jgi:hypothetical protein